MATLKTNTRIELTYRKVTSEGEAILAHIREQIKKARQQQNLSTRELSQKVNHSTSFISKVEQGTLQPGILDLLALTVILQKPLKYFVPTYYKEKDEDLTGEEWELIRHFRKIKNDDTRRIAVNTMQQLAEIQ